MPTELFVVPSINGQEGAGMGAGPLDLELDALQALHPARVERVTAADAPHALGAAFDVNRQLAAHVAGTRGRGALPVVLSGGCMAQQAVLAGVGIDGLGLVWLDCHADFHTLETTTSGFFDALSLSMVVGDCADALCASVPGFAPLPADRVLMAGVRDVDAGERARLDAAPVTEVADVAELPALVERFERVSLHIDLDVLDPERAGRANAYATPGGLTREALLDTVRAVAAARPLAALTVTAYDPAADADGRARDVALEVLALVA